MIKHTFTATYTHQCYVKSEVTCAPPHVQDQNEQSVISDRCVLTASSNGYDGDQQDAAEQSQADSGEAVGSGATQPGGHYDSGHWVI